MKITLPRQLLTERQLALKAIDEADGNQEKADLLVSRWVHSPGYESTINRLMKPAIHSNTSFALREWRGSVPTPRTPAKVEVYSPPETGGSLFEQASDYVSNLVKRDIDIFKFRMPFDGVPFGNCTPRRVKEIAERLRGLAGVIGKGANTLVLLVDGMKYPDKKISEQTTAKQRKNLQKIFESSSAKEYLTVPLKDIKLISYQGKSS